MKKFLLLACMLLLAACAPQEQAFNAPTASASIDAHAFTAVDGAELPLRSWIPAKPKAVIVALHGFNDYSNGFTHGGEYFKRRGIATYAIDQRGFGDAPGHGIWAGENNLTRDAATLVELAAKKYPSTPIYLLGESMGGAVAIMTLTQNPDLPVKGAVLVAPAVWGGHALPPFYRAVLWSSAHTLPWYELTGRGLKIRASDNIEMLRAMGRDPKVIKSTRVDAIYGLVDLMGDAYENADKLPRSVLLLHGGQDQVIPRKPIEKVASNLPDGSDVIYYEDGYHMLTRDLAGDKVLADIARWVLTRR